MVDIIATKIQLTINVSVWKRWKDVYVKNVLALWNGFTVNPNFKSINRGNHPEIVNTFLLKTKHQPLVTLRRDVALPCVNSVVEQHLARDSRLLGKANRFWPRSFVRNGRQFFRSLFITANSLNFPWHLSSSHITKRSWLWSSRNKGKPPHFRRSRQRMFRSGRYFLDIFICKCMFSTPRCLWILYPFFIMKSFGHDGNWLVFWFLIFDRTFKDETIPFFKDQLFHIAFVHPNISGPTIHGKRATLHNKPPKPFIVTGCFSLITI